MLCFAIYAVTLHPLASYKGPILWTTTRIPHTCHILKGTLSFKNAELHKKYDAVVLCVTSGIAFTFTIIFQCHPISYAWNRDLKGTCVDHNAASWANARINVLQDILIVLLLVPELRILQLSTRRRSECTQCLVWDSCKHLFLLLSGYPYQNSQANLDFPISVCILSIIRFWSLPLVSQLT